MKMIKDSAGTRQTLVAIGLFLALIMLDGCGASGSSQPIPGNSCTASTVVADDICRPVEDQPPYEALNAYAAVSGCPNENCFIQVNGGSGGNTPVQNYFSWDDQANTRPVHYALPLGDPGSEADNPTNYQAGKWPVVIYLRATVPTTNPENYNPFALETETNCGQPANNSFSCTQTQLRNILFMKLLKAGFAVILPQPFEADSWYYSEATSADLLPDKGNCCASYSQEGVVTCSNSDLSPIPNCPGNYWPGPDKSFMGTLFDEMDEPAGRLGNGTLDTTKVSLMGYSVGGSMVSRLINEQAASQGTAWTPQGKPFPELVSAMILSAGSYYCFSTPSSEIPGGGVRDCPRPSVGVTELEYWPPPYPDPPEYTGEKPTPVVSWSEHPATILVQLIGDSNADEDDSSSTWYYEVLTESSQATGELCRIDPSAEFLDTCLKLTTQSGRSFTIRHAFFPEAVEPTYDFVLQAHGG